MSSFADLKKQRENRQRVCRPAVDSPGSSAPRSSAGALRAGPSSASDFDISQSELIPESAVLDLPDSFEVRKTQLHGRGVYARRRIQKGKVIFETRPSVSVVSTRLLDQYCGNCGLPPADVGLKKNSQISPLKRCTLCRLVHYCSVACQRADWASHKLECAAHRALRTVYTREHSKNKDDGGWIMSESIRALGRLCWARKAARKDGRDPDWWKGIASMESHVKRMSEEDVLKLGQLAQRLRHYLFMAEPGAANSTSPQPVKVEDFGFQNSAEILDLISALDANSFTLSTPSLTRVGMTCHPTAALFNHSCRPSAVVVFPEGAERLAVVAIRDIEAGEEVLISYVDVAMDREERQRNLKAEYRFDCDCPACVEQESAVQPERSDMERRVILQSKEMVKDDEQGRLNLHAVKAVLNSLTVAMTRIPDPPMWTLHSLYRLVALAHIPPESETDQQLAIKALESAYPITERLYPEGHPLRAIILAEWGKLLAMEPLGEVGRQVVLQRLVQAVSVLRQAFKACEAGFGKGGGLVGKEVEGLIRGCEGEIGLIRRYASVS